MDKDKFHEQDEKNKLDIFPKLVDCILLVITICIILFIIIEIVGAFIIGIKLSKEIHVKETIELYSIGTGDKIKGSFSMYHGSIEEVDYYCCYRKTADGGKTYYKFEMDETTVYETLKSGEQAYVEVLEDGLGMLKGYRLYVPENTIVQEIDLSIVK